MKPLRAGLSATALLLAASASPLWSQTIAGRAADIEIGGRLHTQFATSSIEDEGSNFFIRRARITVDLGLGEHLDARIMPEVAGGSASLQDAYVRYAFSPGFRVSAGQFKRAFDLFELESSTNLPLVERDGRIPGFSECTGPDGTCSYSRLSEKLRFAGRDVGVRVDGSLGEGGSYMLSLTNGTGVNRSDENGGKSVSGRVTFRAADDVRIGANVGVHDYMLTSATDGPNGSTEYATAGGVDVTVGTYRGGLRFMGSVLFGDNWSADPSGDTGFTAFQVLGSYYHELTQSDVLHGIEPVLRVSYGDPDRDTDDDGGMLITPGILAYFHGRNRIGLNVDVYSPQGGADTEYSFKVMSFVYF